MDDVRDPEAVRTFLGPADQTFLEALPGLNDEADETNGRGRYGEAWRLPLSHEARASVGVRLALLGDRRKGVGLTHDGVPDIDWVPIPSGKVTIEIRQNPNDPNSAVIDRLEQQVGCFRMARFPVTVGQFRAFLAACHRNGTWSLPSNFPIDISGSYRPPVPRARFSNHPMDSVNWYDASAFCHWLSACVGQDVRLPTEAEWQLAACGGDPMRIYPWGEEWDMTAEPWRANTLESDLQRTTAVGMYPAGASPHGLLDMAGTLWEWCLDVFDSPGDTAFKVASGSRVLRGGSWYNDFDSVRVADRGRLTRNSRNDVIGFRVVCSSPSQSTDS